jgi:hypothetical protein
MNKQIKKRMLIGLRAQTLYYSFIIQISDFLVQSIMTGKSLESFKVDHSENYAWIHRYVLSDRADQNEKIKTFWYKYCNENAHD